MMKRTVNGLRKSPGWALGLVTLLPLAVWAAPGRPVLAFLITVLLGLALSFRVRQKKTDFSPHLPLSQEVSALLLLLAVISLVWMLKQSSPLFDMGYYGRTHFLYPMGIFAGFTLTVYFVLRSVLGTVPALFGAALLLFLIPGNYHHLIECLGYSFLLGTFYFLRRARYTHRWTHYAFAALLLIGTVYYFYLWAAVIFLLLFVLQSWKDRRLLIGGLSAFLLLFALSVFFFPLSTWKYSAWLSLFNMFPDPLLSVLFWSGLFMLVFSLRDRRSPSSNDLTPFVLLWTVFALLWTFLSGERSRLQFPDLMRAYGAVLLPALLIVIPALVRVWVNRVLIRSRWTKKGRPFIASFLGVFLLLAFAHSLFSFPWNLKGWTGRVAAVQPAQTPTEVVKTAQPAAPRIKKAVQPRRVRSRKPVRTERPVTGTSQDTGGGPGLAFTHLSGKKIVGQRVDDRVGMGWSRKAKPGTGRARWTGMLRVPAQGTVHFALQTNVRCVIRLNDRTLFVKETGHKEELTCVRELAPGLYPFSAEAELTQAPVFLLLWGDHPTRLKEITSPYFILSP